MKMVLMLMKWYHQLILMEMGLQLTVNSQQPLIVLNDLKMQLKLEMSALLMDMGSTHF